MNLALLQDKMSNGATILAFCALQNRLDIALQKDGACETRTHMLNADLDRALFVLLREMLTTDVSVQTVLTIGGPLPFTALRILVSTLKGLQRGFNCKAYMVKTFDLLRLFLPDTVLMLVDSRRGDYFGQHLCNGIVQEERMFTTDEISNTTCFVYREADPIADNLATGLITGFQRQQFQYLTEPCYMHTPQYRTSLLNP